MRYCQWDTAMFLLAAAVVSCLAASVLSSQGEVPWPCSMYPTNPTAHIPADGIQQVPATAALPTRQHPQPALRGMLPRAVAIALSHRVLDLL